MSTHTANNHFFIPKLKSHDPAVITLQKKYPAPEKWSQGLFVYNRHSTPYFFSRAKNEKAIVVGTTGLNTLHLLDEKDVQKLNDAGISVIWMSLPLPKRGQNVNDIAVEMVRAFLTSPASPAHVLFPTDTPKYLATYSTSGRIAMQLLHEEGTREKLADIFSGAVYVAPYLDTANASKEYNPYKDLIFQAFARKYPNLTPHETAFGRAYLHTIGRRENYSKDNKPTSSLTYGQILDLQSPSRSLLKNFNATYANAIPSVFLVGDKDPFACHKTTTGIARAMGADIITAQGAGHYPMYNAPHLMDEFIRRVEICIAKNEQARITTTLISAQDYWELHRKPAIGEPAKIFHLSNYFPTPQSLRRGTSTALQRTASALNPLASFL